MPKLTPRAIAFDPHQNRSVVLAQAKKKYLLGLDEAGGLELLRPVPAPSETFWIAGAADQRAALFWSIGKLSLQPLAGGRGKSLKSYDAGTFARHVAFSNSARWLGVEGKLVYQLMSDRLDVVDGTAIDGHVWLATTDGVYRRPIGGVPGDWRVLDKTSTPYLKTTAWDPESDTFAVGEHSGRLRFFSADGDIDEVKLSDLWCIEHHDGAFYVWSKNKVSRLERDGALHDTGVTGEPHNDNCLGSTSHGLCFLEGTTIHRLANGRWQAIDLEPFQATAELA